MDIDLSKIKLFVFDFDGTLVQSNHVKAQAFIDVVSIFSNGDPRAIAALNMIKQDNPHFDRYEIFNMLETQFPNLDADILVQAYGKQCEEIILQAPEVDGAAFVLKGIKNLERRAIINSATPKSSLEMIVEKLPIKTYIDKIYGSPKSKTENLQDVMSTFNLCPSEILVIGDGANDKEASCNIGCQFYGITNEYSDLDPTEQSLYTDLNVLANALKRI